MKYRTKAEKLLELNPDLVVIPECENPERLIFADHLKKPDAYIWYGENPNKGLGVFSYSGFKFKMHKWHVPDYKMILPIAVSKGNLKFNLFAVWANNVNDKKFQYVGQTWKAIHAYAKHLKKTNTILAGDFNSNTIWDRPSREGNHSALVKKLADKKIHSLYHLHKKEEQGKEKSATHFLYRHENKPYHLDYCFASNDFAEKMTTMEVGTHHEWKSYSDHVPLSVTFDL